MPEVLVTAALNGHSSFANERCGKIAGMKKLIRRIAGLLSGAGMLATLPACAQQSLPTPVENTRVPIAEVGLDGPALWRVADEDTTIYLFGTVHALPEGMDWYRGTISDALTSSDVLVTEILTDESMAATMQQLVAEKAVLPEGQTLRSLLDDEQRASYEKAVTDLGVPVAAFDRFEPWYAAMMLSMLPLLQQGYTPDQGVEKILEGRAGAGLGRAELETVDYQITLFDQLPMESQIRFLAEVAGNVDKMKPMIDAIVAEWLEGDADGLAALMNDSMTDPVLAEWLLYNRNRNWAEWIDTRLDQPGTVFIAVGAGHLAGEKSVQDALADRGIQTERVQ